jgi:predicted RNase H-like HicB family nuclease
MKYPVLVSAVDGKYVARCLLVDSIHAEGDDLSRCLKEIREQFVLKVCGDSPEIIIVMDGNSGKGTAHSFFGEYRNV